MTTVIINKRAAMSLGTAEAIVREYVTLDDAPTTGTATTDNNVNGLTELTSGIEFSLPLPLPNRKERRANNARARRRR